MCGHCAGKIVQTKFYGHVVVHCPGCVATIDDMTTTRALAHTHLGACPDDKHTKQCDLLTLEFAGLFLEGRDGIATGLSRALVALEERTKQWAVGGRGRFETEECAALVRSLLEATVDP